MDNDQVLEILVGLIEEKFGPIPMVSSPETLFADFRRWIHQGERGRAETSSYGKILAEKGFIPCRSADGTICLVFLNDGASTRGEVA